MNDPTFLLTIGVNLVALGVHGGILWEKVSSAEDESARRHKEVKGELEELSEQARRRNGRIGDLEHRLREREAFDEGYRKAKKKYGPTEASS